jgi:ATP-binding cassette subfamily B protein
MGTHNELLAQRGLYWRLYQLQYSDEKLHLSTPPGDHALEPGLAP